MAIAGEEAPAAVEVLDALEAALALPGVRLVPATPPGMHPTRSAEVVIRTPAPVTRVEIDADRAFPDVNRANNVWERQ